MARRVRNSPSDRWTREHGYGTPGSARRKERRFKIAYRSWWRARWDAFLVNRRTPDEGQRIYPYACQWGADYRDGETAERHWHNGRRKADDMWGY